MIVKDAMTIIHLAKITLLEKSCDYFKNVMVPESVYSETIRMEDKYPETNIIKNLVERNKMKIHKVTNKNLMEKANQYNIQGGEAEAIALYWQEKADFIATDDDNVRKKSVLLNLNVIGTPAIIFGIYKKKMIDKKKFVDSLSELRKIGWFSNAIIDKLLLEVLK